MNASLEISASVDWQCSSKDSSWYSRMYPSASLPEIFRAGHLVLAETPKAVPWASQLLQSVPEGPGIRIVEYGAIFHYPLLYRGLFSQDC